MVRLVTSIYCIPISNPFKLAVIQVFNKRCTEFQHHLLCYYLHPFYRSIQSINIIFFFLIYWILFLGVELWNEAFQNAAITVSTIWQSLGYSEQQGCKESIAQFR